MKQLTLDEAATVVRRLLNERKALEHIDAVLAAARDAVSRRDALQRGLADLQQRKAKAEAEVARLEAYLNDERDRVAKAEAEHGARLKQLAEELERARRQHAQELTEMKRRADEQREELLAQHEALRSELEAREADLKRRVATAEHELEAVRRKMSGLLANG